MGVLPPEEEGVEIYLVLPLLVDMEAGLVLVDMYAEALALVMEEYGARSVGTE